MATQIRGNQIKDGTITPAKLSGYAGKLSALFHSRKFWALIVALVGVLAGLNMGDIDTWQAVKAAVAALSAYSIGTGIEAAGQVQAQAAPPVAASE